LLLLLSSVGVAPFLSSCRFVVVVFAAAAAPPPDDDDDGDC